MFMAHRQSEHMILRSPMNFTKHEVGLLQCFYVYNPFLANMQSYCMICATASSSSEKTVWPNCERFQCKRNTKRNIESLKHDE